MRLPLVLGIGLSVFGFCTEEAVERADDVPVTVGSVALDPRSGTPVVVLEETTGARVLPIWIGFSEARSIASEMEGETSPRPNSHDLATRLLARLRGELVRVVVTELRQGTFFAVLVIRSDGRTVEIDARPSDAIAIALRVSAPLFVREPVFEDAAAPDVPGRGGERIHHPGPVIRNSPATRARATAIHARIAPHAASKHGVAA